MRKLLSVLLALAMVFGMIGMTVYAEEAQLIDSIELYLPSVPAVGEMLCDVESIEVPEDAPYTIKEAYWYGWSLGEECDITQPCVASAYYYLEMVFEPAEGYSFAEYCTIYINGEDSGAYYHDVSEEELYINLGWDVYYESVGEVLLSVEGDNLGADVDDITVSVLNSELVFVDEVRYDIYNPAEDEYEPYDGIIEDGTVIRATIILSCADEHSFYDSSILINGEHPEWSSDYATMEVCYYIENLEEVEEFLVNGVTEPKVGELPSVSGLTVPEGVPYEIVEAYWLDVDTYEMQETAFEDGCAYYLIVNLKIADGYMVSDEAWAMLDDKHADFWHSDYFNVTIQQRYSLKEKITKVDLTGLEVPVAGAKPDVDIVVPDVINSDEVYISWSDWNTGEYDMEVFADKGIYEVSIVMNAVAGLEFAEDVVVTLDGKECQCSSNGESLYVYKTYSLGYEYIDAINITIPQIEEGQNAADVKVEFSDGVEVVEAMWGVTDKDTIEDADVFEGAFEAGMNYFYAALIYANEDMMFADDLKVTVNGIVLDDEFVEAYMTNAIIYYGPMTTDGQGTTPPVTPPTGELDLLAPMMALLVLSGAGLVVMMMLKKRRYC